MAINLSTGLFYDRSKTAMQSLTSRAETLSTQISTGKKLLSPSDGSVAYQRLQGIARATIDAATDTTNIKLAQSVLQQADTTLTQITEQLQRASELTIQAKNGTQSPEGRAAIATELEGIVDSIAALANTKDARGQPLFGGAAGAVAVTKGANGAFAFAAGEASAIPIGDGQDVQPGSNAANFLATGGTDIGTALTAIAAALRADEAVPAGASDALDAISNSVTATQTSLGARAARVDLIYAQMQTNAADREVTRSGIEDVNVADAITELQKTMTILQATQASFSKLSQLSLFDYLR